MRWYLDTEFDENGRTIELISLGLVNADGGYHYWVSRDFDPKKCNDWVKKNVLPKIESFGSRSKRKLSREQIAKEVLQVVRASASGSKPEFWGYFADYDWVVFCQLFGCMIDLPKGWPMYCRDLKQEMDRLGVKRKDLPNHLRLPSQNSEHIALYDALWNRHLHDFLIAVERERLSK